MSFHRDLEHRETPERVVPSRSRTPGKAQAGRFVEIQISAEPLCVPFCRDLDLAQANLRAVSSRSNSRPGHVSCSGVETRHMAKPLCVPLGRDSSKCIGIWVQDCWNPPTRLVYAPSCASAGSDALRRLTPNHPKSFRSSVPKRNSAAF